MLTFRILAASLAASAFLLQSCVRSPQAREAAFLKKGESLVAKKQYARAVLEFRNAMRAMPQDAEPLYQLGIACMRAGDDFDAERAFRRATELNPKHVGAQTKLAELLDLTRNSDQIDNAATRLKRVLQADPNDEEATDALAVTELQLGNSAAAKQRLEDSLHKFPSRLKSSVVLARMMLLEGNLKGAQAVLQKAASAAPDSAAAHVALGQILVLSGELAKAKPEIERAIQLDPKNSSALLTLALLQIRETRMIEAEKTMRQLSLLPDPATRDLHALFLFQLGKRAAAISELQAILSAHPESRPTRNRLFAMYLATSRLQDAQKLVDAALKHNPKDAAALFERTQLYLKTGKPLRAEQDIKELLHLEPASPRAHFQLARIYAVEHLRNSERQELNRTLQLDKMFLAARLALAKSFVLTNQPDAALSTLDEAPDSQKNTVAVLVARNWALFEAGHTAELRLALNRILRVSRTPEALLQDGLLRMEEKDYAGARADAEELLKSNPSDSRGARLLADTYLAGNHTSEATTRLAALAAAHPKIPSLHLLLGQWYLRNGRAAEAQKAFQAALAINPSLARATVALAEIDRREHHDAAGRKRLKALLADRPGNLSALLLLANISHDMGDRAAEIAAYKSALTIDDSDEYVLNNLACALAGTDMEAALPLAKRAVAASPNNAAAQDTLGWLYYRKKMYAAAVAHLRASVDQGSSPVREFHLAMAYMKDGQTDSGKHLLKRALKEDPKLAATEQAW